jgi:hypothetical protein
MRHARSDYDRIQDPSGKIPEDEPVFLLRGQDQTAAATVRHWASLQASESPLRTLAEAHAARMDAWAVKKEADGPHEGEAAAGASFEARQAAACVLFSAWAARDAASRREPLIQDHTEEARLARELGRAKGRWEAFQDRKATFLALDRLLPGWVDLDVSDLLPRPLWHTFIHPSPHAWRTWLVSHGVHPNTAEAFVIEQWPKPDERRRG